MENGHSPIAWAWFYSSAPLPFTLSGLAGSRLQGNNLQAFGPVSDYWEEETVDDHLHLAIQVPHDRAAGREIETRMGIWLAVHIKHTLLTSLYRNDIVATPQRCWWHRFSGIHTVSHFPMFGTRCCARNQRQSRDHADISVLAAGPHRKQSAIQCR